MGRDVNKPRAVALWAVLAAAVLAAAAVAAGTATASSSQRTATKPPTFQLNVGNVMSFTGSLAGFGPSLDASAKIAIDMINTALEKNGMAGSMSVRLVGSEDDQTQVPAAVEAATKLITVQKAQVIIGTILSASTIAVAQSVTVPNNVVQIAPTSSSTAISDLNDNDLVWRVSTSDAFQSTALVTAAAARFGKGALLNVGARNDAFGTALRDLFVDKWKANGGSVGQVVTWNPDAPNFDSEAQQLVRGNPAGWVIIDLSAGFERLAPSLVRAGGWSADKTMVTGSMRNAALLKRIGDDATDGLRGVSPVAPKNNVRSKFDALFTARASGKPATGFEATAFDGVMLSFLAAVKAGSSDPAAIKKQMRAVSGPPGKKYTYLQLRQAIRDLVAGNDIDYEGVWGPIDWDAKGDPTAGFIEAWRYKDGALHTVATFKLSNTSTKPKK